MMRIILLLFLLATTVFAQEKSGSFNPSDRAKKRETSRWTLAEWLAQKERNRMMDMWLQMNSSSPFEFSLLGANTNYKKTLSAGTNEYTITSLEATAYAKIFGLTAEYENRSSENENDFSGMLNVRVLGDSIQASSLVLHYGQSTRTFSSLEPTVIARNTFAQATLQIYLSRYFGINGLYRQYQPFSTIYFGDVSGTLNQAGVFIDFEFIRVFGYWFEDIQKNTNTPTVDAEIKRNGIKTGLQFFF